MKYTLISAALLLTSLLSAETYHVSADAAPGGDGSKEKPFSKIQQGLDKAMPGDTVELAPGVYFERIKFPRSGKFGKPVRLNGPRTAIIDGSTAFAQEWKKIPDYGPNAWHTKVPDDFFPPSVAHKGSGLVISPEGLIIQLYEKRVGCLKNALRDERDLWYAPELMKKGIGKTGMKHIKALAMYRFKQKDVIVSYGDARDVSKAKLIFSPPLPSVIIENVDRCVVSGITIRHAHTGILIKNSIGSVVEDCRILRSERGVEIRDASEKCTVRFCEISMDPVFGCDPWPRGNWDAWKGHKRGGFWDRIAVNIVNTRGGHQIHDNFLHNHWGGVQDAGDNPDLNVHHNFIDKISDDGLEPNGSNRNCRWHHNLMTNNRCGFRIKCIQIGPIYAYGNLFYNNKEDFRHYKNHLFPDATGFFYHNTSNTIKALNNNAVKMPHGVKNFHFLNNIFICDKLYGGSHTVNWHDAGNVYFRRNNSPDWHPTLEHAKKIGFKSTSKFLNHEKHGIKDFAKGDFSLAADSPARNAGIDLTQYDLPGIEEFQAKDAGAVPFGKSTFKVYRNKSKVKHPPAGFWPEDKK